MVSLWNSFAGVIEFFVNKHDKFSPDNGLLCVLMSEVNAIAWEYLIS